MRPGVPATQAEPTEPDRDVDVLLPPPHEAHVVPVDALEVRAGDPEEVAVRSVVGDEFGHAASPNAAAIATRQSAERADLAPRTVPLEHAPAMHRELLREDAPCEDVRDVHAAGRGEPSRLDARAERADEVAPRDRLPVHEREVVGVDRERAQVQDPGEAKPLVRLPRVDESLSEGRSPAVHERLRVGARAVVGHDERESLVGLLGERPQDGIESLGPFVRADDNREPGMAGCCGSHTRSHVQSRSGRTTPRHCPLNCPRAESPSPGSSTSNDTAS